MMYVDYMEWLMTLVIYYNFNCANVATGSITSWQRNGNWNCPLMWGQQMLTIVQMYFPHWKNRSDDDRIIHPLTRKNGGCLTGIIPQIAVVVKEWLLAGGKQITLTAVTVQCNVHWDRIASENTIIINSLEYPTERKQLEGCIFLCSKTNIVKAYVYIYEHE